MMKRLTAAVLLLCLLTGCVPGKTTAQKQYSATFLTLFDTVTTITGKDSSKEAFEEKAKAIHDELLEYHQLFDIYHDYEGINNLKTINDGAGVMEIPVDERIIELLKDCKQYYERTGGKVNVAMGSVLKLWHDARNDGINNPMSAYLPGEDALQEAALHTSLDAVIIDEAAKTVYITDEAVRLDVGAIAKGWATERVARTAPEGLLISVGGNVCATGPKDDSGTPWVIGIQDPDGSEEYLHTVYLTEGSVVTSGDYQRTYQVDGKLYHHIIDPDTLYPSQYWRSVTVVFDDSGLADALSTALFLLPLEDGKALAESCGANAMWVDAQGSCHYTPGFEEIIRT